jgi:hypothetical protein
VCQAAERAKAFKQSGEELKQLVARTKEAERAALARFQEEFGPQPRAARAKEVGAEQARQKGASRSERRENSKELRSRGEADEKRRLGRNQLQVARVKVESAEWKTVRRDMLSDNARTAREMRERSDAWRKVAWKQFGDADGGGGSEPPAHHAGFTMAHP